MICLNLIHIKLGRVSNHFTIAVAGFLDPGKAQIATTVVVVVGVVVTLFGRWKASLTPTTVVLVLLVVVTRFR